MDISTKAWIEDGYIPDWLIEQLLIRLPPKVVFTYKVVSKKWLSIIVDPCFVKMYCSRALSLQKYQPWSFISRFGKDNHFRHYTFSCNFDWPQFSSLSLPHFPHPNEERNFIHGVSNGFVLYGPINGLQSCIDFSIYRICNPVTGQWISIPRNHEIGYVKSHEINTCCSFMTNVKDGVLMSYTVVCLHGSKRDQINFITCYVLLSEVGEWKKYTFPVDTSIQFSPYNSSAILNGVMHWELWKPQLVAYDPHKHPDRVRIIALPYRNPDPSYSICAAYQEKLRYFWADAPLCHLLSFNIWVLNNYSSDEWCLQHRVYYDDIQICSTLSSQDLSRIGLKSFHPYNSDIVCIGCNGMVMSYNIKTKKLEFPKDIEQAKTNTTLSCLQALMLQIPPWPISYSRPLLELQS